MVYIRNGERNFFLRFRILDSRLSPSASLSFGAACRLVDTGQVQEAPTGIVAIITGYVAAVYAFFLAL